MVIKQAEKTTSQQTTTKGTIEAIWLKRFIGGPMDAVDHAEAVTDQGLVGDANRRPKPGNKRQVTIIDQAAWEAATAELGVAVDPSARRANVLVSGIDLAKTHKRVLQLGQVCIRIYGETRPCEQMDKASPGLRLALDPDWRAGAFGEVLNDGEFAVGDTVRWVE